MAKLIRFSRPARSLPSPAMIARLYLSLTHDGHKETVWRVLKNLLDLEAALGSDDDSPTGRPGGPCVRVEPGTQ